MITYLTISVPEPKECAEANSSAIVELLPSKDFWCPVSAFLKFSAISKSLGPEMPLFTDGRRLLTSGLVNDTLRRLLRKHVDYNTRQVLGHSFRAGVISALARVGADKTTMMSQVNQFHLPWEGFYHTPFLGQVEFGGICPIYKAGQIRQTRHPEEGFGDYLLSDLSELRQGSPGCLNFPT